MCRNIMHKIEIFFMRGTYTNSSTVVFNFQDSVTVINLNSIELDDVIGKMLLITLRSFSLSKILTYPSVSIIVLMHHISPSKNT